MMELLKLIEPVQGRWQLRVSMAFLNFYQGRHQRTLFRKKYKTVEQDFHVAAENIFRRAIFHAQSEEKNCKNSLLSKS